MSSFLWLSQAIARWRRMKELQKAKQWRLRVESQPGGLALEPRRVLNAAPVVPNAAAAQPAEVIVNAGKSANDGKADTFTVSRSSAGDVVSVNGKTQQIVAPGSKLVIQGSNDADVVRIDFKDGNPLNSTPIQIIGNGGTDSVQLAGSASVVVHQFSGDGTGQIVVDGAAVTYSPGIAVKDQLNVSQRIFEISSAGNATLTSDSATGTDDFVGPFGQTVQFDQSTADLEIRNAQITHDANQISIAGFQSAVRENLTIYGDSQDTVIFVGHTNLQSGNLSVYSGVIDVSAQVHTDRATVGLYATRQLIIDAGASISNDSGLIIADAGATGSLIVSGHLDVSNLRPDQVGGAIHLLGKDVGLAGATIEARGDAGGGRILVGGDFQGKNSNIRNASLTRVDGTTTLNASAVTKGNGGKVIVWSDDVTLFAGGITVTGGTQSGHGGFAEVSSHNFLGFQGRFDALASHGQSGSLLLDPTNLTIDNTSDQNINISSPFVPQNTPSVLTWGTIVDALTGGNVLVTTSGSPDSGTETGLIEVKEDSGDLNSTNQLTLQAASSITIGGTITNTKSGGLVLDALGGDIKINSVVTLLGDLTMTVTGETLINSAVSAANVSVSSTGTITVGAQTQATGAGTVGLDATGATSDVLVNADVISGSGALTLKAGRDITMNAGNLTTTGAVNLTAGAAISEAGAGLISGGLLTTGSTTGTTLNNLNLISSFKATNTTSGDVSLKNSGALSVTGIDETGGNVSVTNAGTITVADKIAAATTGTVDLIATGATSDILVNADVTSGSGALSLNAGENVLLNAGNPTTTGAVNLTAGSIISEAGAGLISGGLLTASSTAGTTLNNTNQVSGFKATNTTSGDVSLNNSGALSVTGIDETGGNISVTNAGTITVADTVSAATTGTVDLIATGATSDILLNADVTSGSGALSLNAGQNITLNAGNLTTTGAVNLTAGSIISEAGAGLISGGLLTASSTAGTTLNNANQISSFTATNTLSGNVTLNNAGNLDLTSIDETGGNVSVTNAGTITVVGNVSAAGAGTVDLVATGTGSDILVNADVTSTSGNVSLNAANNITLNAGNLTTTGDVNITAGGAISEAGTGLISGGTLTTSSVTGTLLDNANLVAQFQATNSTSGNVSLSNDADLKIIGIDETGGNVSLSVAGTITVIGKVSAADMGTVNLTATGATTDILLNDDVVSGSGELTLNAGHNVTLNAGNLTTTGGVNITAGNVISEAAAGLISCGLLTTMSQAGVTLTNSNQVTGFNATNTASGDVVLNNVGALDVTGIDETGGNVSVTNAGGITVSGNVMADGAGTVDLIATGNTSDILVNADVTSNSGALTLNAGNNVTLNAGNLTTTGAVNVTAGSSISEAGTGIISGGLLTTSSSAGTTLTNTNLVTDFKATNSTSGDISLKNDVSLNVTGIDETGGNVLLTVNGVIAISGAIHSTGGAVGLDAIGDITQTAEITAVQLGAVSRTGTVDLSLATNNVQTFAASAVSTGQDVNFQDADGFDVGVVIPGTFFGSGLQGIVTDQLTGVVRLESGTGDITQTEAIRADRLGAEADSGSVKLCDVDNSVNTFAGKATPSGPNAGGTVAFANSLSLTLGTVTKGGGSAGSERMFGTLGSDLTGIVAPTAIDLIASGTGTAGDLNIVDPLSSETIRLQSLNGAIAQGAGGKLTAVNLSAQAASSIDLSLPTNDVNNVSLIGSTTIRFVDAPTSGVLNIAQVAGDDCIGTSTGVLTSTASGIGKVILAVTGDIVQSESITSDAVAAISQTGTIDLSLATNQVNVLAAQATTAQQEINFQNSTAFEVGTVNDALIPGGTLQGVHTDQATGIVRLQSTTGNINQTQSVVADQLGAVATTGSVDLSLASNSVNIFAASATAGTNEVNFQNAISFEVAQVASGGGDDPLNNPRMFSSVTGGAVVGITTDQNSGTVRLQAASGDITQSEAIVAKSLGAASLTGIVNLSLETNSVLVFAASAETATKEVDFQNAIGFEVGSVSKGGGSDPIDAPRMFLSTPGVDLNGIHVSQSSGTVRLQTVTGDVTQTQAIVADKLGAEAISGSVKLCEVDNAVNTFAAKATPSAPGVGGTVAFANSLTLNLGTVSKGGGPPSEERLFGTSISDLTGIVAPTAIDLIATGTGTAADLKIIDSLTSTTVRLQSLNGSISQEAGGVITATNLSAQASTQIDLSLPVNNVDNVALLATTTIRFVDAPVSGTLNIAEVAGDDCVGTVTGVVTDKVPGSGKFILGVQGNVTQSAAVTADQVAVISQQGSIDLSLPGNNVNVFAAQAMTTQKEINFQDSIGFEIGTVNDPLLPGGQLRGVTTDQETGIVRLQSATGNVIQSQAVIADQLGAVAVAGSVDLSLSTNSVSVFAASAAGTNSEVDLQSSTGFNIGTVSKGGGTDPLNPRLFSLVSGPNLVGITTAQGDGTVRLQALTGDISQTEAITANALGAAAIAGKVDLSLATNSVNIFAARATSAGQEVDFQNATGFAVGTVAAGGRLASIDDPRLFTTVPGVELNGITVDQTTGTVRLQAVTGDITQTQAITADKLGVEAKTGLVLMSDLNNQVGTFAAKGSKVVFANAAPIQLGTVTAGGGPSNDRLFDTVPGVGLTNISGNGAGLNPIPDEIDLIAVNGDLQLNAPLASTTVRLKAMTGAVYQNAGVGIDATNLAVQGATYIDLTNAQNDVDNFAALASAYIYLNDQPVAGSLNIATVAGDAYIGATTGVSATDTEGTVGLSIQGNLTQGREAVTPVAEALDAIQAKYLGVVATGGSIDLSLATNSVSVFAARAITPSTEINFQNGTAVNGFDIGLVTTTPMGSLFGGPLQGIMTDGATGIVRLQALSGNITQGLTSASSAEELLDSITAQSLGAVAVSGNVDLSLSTNVVGVFAAQGLTEVNFQDSTGFDIGTVTAGGTDFDGGVRLFNNTPGTDLVGITTTTSSATAGVVRLQALAGDITQSGQIDTYRLGAVADLGKVDLSLPSNDVRIFAARGMTEVNFQDGIQATAGVDIGKVSAGGLDRNGDVRMFTPFNLSPDLFGVTTTTADPATGVVRLQVLEGDITQGVLSAADEELLSAIHANQLGAVAVQGKVDLSLQSNLVAIFAAKANSEVDFQNAVGFDIGSITAGGTGLSESPRLFVTALGAGLSGIETDSTLGVVRLQSMSGDITQGLTSSSSSEELLDSITAWQLGAVADAGRVDLSLSTNNVRIFAARASTEVNFQDGLQAIAGFDVGTVAAGGLNGSGGPRMFHTLSVSGPIASDLHGITTTLSEPDSGIVRLQALAGDITQGVTAATAGEELLDSITAQSLGAVANAGKVDLSLSTNKLDVIAARAVTEVNFQDGTDATSGFDVGTVTAGGTGRTGGTRLFEPVASDANLHGITTTATADGVVRLQTLAGDITQSDAINTNQLGAVSSQGKVDLSLSTNNVDVFAARGVTEVNFQNGAGATAGFDVGTVIAGGSGRTGGSRLFVPVGSDVNLHGITTTSTSGGVVRLQALAGDITQSDAISTNQLGAVSSQGKVDLSLSTNKVDVFAARGVTEVNFQDGAGATTGFNVGTVTAGGTGRTVGTRLFVPVASDANLHGITTTVASGGVVRLQALEGNITQSDAIVTQSLSAGAAAAVDLRLTSNSVDVFAAEAGNHVYFGDSKGLTIDSVSAGGRSKPTDDPRISQKTGVTSNKIANSTDADIEFLITSGDLKIEKPIEIATKSAALNDTVRLWAQNGSILQTPTGSITSSRLSAKAEQGSHSISLENSLNNVQSFAASAPGSISFTDLGKLTITQINGGALATATVDGIRSTNSGEITVTTSNTPGQHDADLIVAAVVDSTGATPGAIHLTGEHTVQLGHSVGHAAVNDQTPVVDINATESVISRTAGSIAARTVNLKAGQDIGSGTSDADLNEELNQPGKGTKDNPIDWNAVLQGNPTGVYVIARTLNLSSTSGSVINGSVWVNVSPLVVAETAEVTPLIATQNVVITNGLSPGDRSGALALDGIGAGGRILIYSTPASVDYYLGSIVTGLSTANSVAIEAGKSLGKIEQHQINSPYHYEIQTGNMLLLQLGENQVYGPFNLATNDGLANAYKNYDFFQVKSPLPTPVEANIRALQSNGIIATYGKQSGGKTEYGWNVVVSWGDLSANPFTSYTSKSADVTSAYTLFHNYAITDQGFYKVDISVAVDPSISLAQRGPASGQNSVVSPNGVTYLEQRVLQTVIPATTVVLQPQFFARPEVIPPTQVMATPVPLATAVQPPVNPPIVFEFFSPEAASVEKNKYLTLSLIPEDGSMPQPVKILQNGQLTEKLDLQILEGDQLIELFKTLPDGHYRLDIYQMLDDEPLDERTILDAVITNGVPSDPIDEIIDQLRRNLDRDDVADPVQPDARGANLEIVPEQAAPLASISPESNAETNSAATVGVWGGLMGLMTSSLSRKRPDAKGFKHEKKKGDQPLS